MKQAALSVRQLLECGDRGPLCYGLRVKIPKRRRAAAFHMRDLKSSSAVSIATPRGSSLHCRFHDRSRTGAKGRAESIVQSHDQVKVHFGEPGSSPSQLTQRYRPTLNQNLPMETKEHRCACRCRGTCD